MDILIQPSRAQGEPELHGPGLLLINPGEAAYCARLSSERGLQRHYLFNSKLYKQPAPPFFWAGPMVGAPMAAMTLEKLIALGGKQFVVYGWCGALHPDLSVGDLLIPTWAASEEGTSRHYPLRERATSSEPLRQQLIDALAAHDIPSTTGPVWTTDAPYRETRQQVTTYGEQGILAVDMEFAALVAVAAFRGVELAAAFLVSDELWREQWTPGFTRKDFRRKNRTLTEHLLQFCQTLTRREEPS